MYVLLAPERLLQICQISSPSFPPEDSPMSENYDIQIHTVQQNLPVLTNSIKTKINIVVKKKLGMERPHFIY